MCGLKLICKRILFSRMIIKHGMNSCKFQKLVNAVGFICSKNLGSNFYVQHHVEELFVLFYAKSFFFFSFCEEIFCVTSQVKIGIQTALTLNYSNYCSIKVFLIIFYSSNWLDDFRLERFSNIYLSMNWLYI